MQQSWFLAVHFKHQMKSFVHFGKCSGKKHMNNANTQWLWWALMRFLGRLCSLSHPRREEGVAWVWTEQLQVFAWGWMEVHRQMLGIGAVASTHTYLQQPWSACGWKIGVKKTYFHAQYILFMYSNFLSLLVKILLSYKIIAHRNADWFRCFLYLVVL